MNEIYDEMYKADVIVLATFHQSEKTFQKECLFCFGGRQVADSKAGS